MVAVAEKVNVKITPLGDRVLVERIEADQNHQGVLCFPEPERKAAGRYCSRRGTGGKDKNGNVIPLAVKLGDKIIFGKYSGSEVKLEGKEYVVVREDDIIGIIE